MRMIDREFFNREAGVDFHEEKVHRIARHIGGYMYRYLAFFKPYEVPHILPPDEFPQEIMTVIDRAKKGAHTRRVRQTPHLADVFDLLQGEDTMVNWEVLSLSPEIAFYATGDLSYALSVKDYMKQQASGADPFS